MEAASGEGQRPRTATPWTLSRMPGTGQVSWELGRSCSRAVPNSAHTVAAKDLLQGAWAAHACAQRGVADCPAAVPFQTEVCNIGPLCEVECGARHFSRAAGVVPALLQAEQGSSDSSHCCQPSLEDTSSLFSFWRQVPALGRHLELVPCHIPSNSSCCCHLRAHPQLPAASPVSCHGSAAILRHGRHRCEHRHMYVLTHAFTPQQSEWR